VQLQFGLSVAIFFPEKTGKQDFHCNPAAFWLFVSYSAFLGYVSLIKQSRLYVDKIY
jgi:hypothetical protein